MSSHIEHIFLDIDGVHADFHSAALRIHNRLDLLDSWPEGERDIPKVLGISRSKYWRAIEAEEFSFWENLEPYPWFDELVDLVSSIASFSLLTASSISPYCASGKVSWIYKQFPKVEGRRFSDFLIGRQKQLLAGIGRVLIDDAESMAGSFSKAGGHGVLFPRPWNRNHAIENPIAFVRAKLEGIQEY